MHSRLSPLAAVLAVPLLLLTPTDAQACYQSCSAICSSSSSCSMGCDGLLALKDKAEENQSDPGYGKLCHSTTCGAWGVCSGGGGGGCLAGGKPVFPDLVGESISSSASVGKDTLQVAVYVEAAARDTGATFGFEFRRPDGTLGWTTLALASSVVTAEYRLNGVVPTGTFSVNGVIADGRSGGMAFGLLWTDAGAQYHLLKSNTSLTLPSASYLGVGGRNLGDGALLARTEPAARELARTLLEGAKLLPANGQYSIAVY